MMREKLNMPDEAVKSFMEAGSFEDCMNVLKDTFPAEYPDIHPNQLPDKVVRHILAVMKKNASPYDPPPDPKGACGR